MIRIWSFEIIITLWLNVRQVTLFVELLHIVASVKWHPLFPVTAIIRLVPNLQLLMYLTNNRPSILAIYLPKLHLNYMTLCTEVYISYIKWGYYQLYQKCLKPDNIQYIEIYLFDHDIKGHGHSDVILLFETMPFLGTLTCTIWKGMDLQT